MGEKTPISWCDHTFNPWWGCTRLSPACDHCYAADWGARFGTEWGPAARRRFQSDAYWNEPLKWNRKAEEAGKPRRVFCASMADVCELLPESHPDFAPMAAERQRLQRLIEATPALDWLLLTKRPQNFTRLFPWEMWPANVWAGTTAENQEQAEKRLPHLLRTPAAVRFISAEPLLGPVDLSQFHVGWSECPGCGTVHDPHPQLPLGSRRLCGGDDERPCEWNGKMPVAGLHLHWVIVGGESGPGARPMHPDWARSLLLQCAAANVPAFMKQAGTALAKEWGCQDKKGGNPEEWPAEFRVREFPEVRGSLGV